MPEPLFKTLTRVDSSVSGTWLGVWMAGAKLRSAPAAQLRKELSNYKASEDETRARSERQDLDYRIIYERFEGIDYEQLVNMYRHLTTLDSMTKVEVNARSTVKICVVDGATHSEIHESSVVWDVIAQSLGLAKGA
ncbi:hypothetical protein MBLNU13_g10830t1 [Cladosporium sp. NU13]